MAAEPRWYLTKLSLSNLPFAKPNPTQSQQMLPLSLLLFFSLLLLLFAFALTQRRRRRNRETQNPTRTTHEPTRLDPAGVIDDDDSAHLTRSLAEALPPDSPDWEKLLRAASEAGSGHPEPGRVEGKRKKKRAKKKSPNCEEEDGSFRVRAKEELVCLYPFTSSSSVTQRKIKQQYDELMKSHHSMGLSLAQVGQFANCLVEAKNELKHKADVIQRKFTITKALLFKADRSSFDRLRQQIYKLELEQKRLEEDAFVYNWLQQQLKLSPAYKKMLEIGSRMDLKAKSGELLENTDTEYTDISFEELLAQEKKDSFWHKNGKLRSCSG